MGLPSGWKEVDRPPRFAKLWKEHMGDVAMPRFFQSRSGLSAIVGREPYGRGPMRWHISLRYGDPGRDGRVPSWEELVDTAHALRPGVVFVVAIPPRSWWVNVHPDVLHLVETLDQPLIAEMRNERRGDTPT